MSRACRDQRRVLRFSPNGEGPARRLFAFGRDGDPTNPPVGVVLNDDQAVAKERAKVAGQAFARGQEIREPRRSHRSGLDERRHEGELRDPHARAAHPLSRIATARGSCGAPRSRRIGGRR